MQRIQVFLYEEQYTALKQLAHFSGVAQSDLIRQGVDLVLQAKQQKQQDWRQAAQQLAGIWQDHAEIGEIHHTIRQTLTKRMDRLVHE